MRQCRAQLLALRPDSEVTSRWIDLHDGMVPQSFSQEALRDGHEMAWRIAGHPDVQDLMAADVVVSFGHAEGGGKGGRHVEFGMALVLGKRLVLVGVREHVFHTAPQVEHFESFDQFLASL